MWRRGRQGSGGIGKERARPDRTRFISRPRQEYRKSAIFLLSRLSLLVQSRSDAVLSLPGRPVIGNASGVWRPRDGKTRAWTADRWSLSDTSNTSTVPREVARLQIQSLPTTSSCHAFTRSVWAPSPNLSASSAANYLPSTSSPSTMPTSSPSASSPPSYSGAPTPLKPLSALASPTPSFSPSPP